MLRKPELSTDPMGHLGSYKGFTLLTYQINLFLSEWDFVDVFPQRGRSALVFL